MRVGGVLSVPYARVASVPRCASTPELPRAINYHGHGMIERATPSTSVSHVMAHERTHLAEYRSYAAAHELEIIDQDVDVHLEFRDGVVVAVAGEAKATLRPRGKSDTTGTQQTPPSAPVGSSSGSGPEAIEGREEGQGAPATLGALPGPGELDQSELQARVLLASAESTLKQLPPQPRTDEEAVALARAEARKQEAEADLRDIENARQTMMLSRVLEQASEVVKSAVKQSAGVAARIAYGGL